MQSAFYHAAAFNQDLTRWDVEHVTSMVNLFNGAKSFAQELGGLWTVSTASQANMFHDSGGGSIKPPPGHEFTSNEELRDAVVEWCVDKVAARRMYGAIEDWKTVSVRWWVQGCNSTQPPTPPEWQPPTPPEWQPPLLPNPRPRSLP